MNAQIDMFDEIIVDNFAGGGGAYASNRAGQYTAYNKAVELAKKAVKQETDIPGCVCCGEIIPESGQFCPKCRREADLDG